MIQLFHYYLLNYYYKYSDCYISTDSVIHMNLNYFINREKKIIYLIFNYKFTIKLLSEINF